MDALETGIADKKAPPVTAQLRGETMAYALQSAVHNLGANFFEPYINYRVQKSYSQKGGSYTQNLLGEFAGDITGASALILAEAVCPKQLHTCTRTMRSWVDPLYTSVAHKVFAKEKNLPGYDQKIEKWKTFQERNLVRSAIIATAGIAGNIATQKLVIGNPAPTKLIFVGKLISTTLTTTLGLTARFYFPEQMKNADKWIAKNFFAPVLKDKVVPDGESVSGTYIDKLAAEKSEKTLSYSR
jgi:hypothetical protein